VWINEALFEKYGVIQENFPMALAHGHFTGTASHERLCMVDKLRLVIPIVILQVLTFPQQAQSMYLTIPPDGTS